MLPLLGESLTAFTAVKAINLVVGLLIGLAVFTCGWCAASAFELRAVASDLHIVVM